MEMKDQHPAQGRSGRENAVRRGAGVLKGAPFQLALHMLLPNGWSTLEVVFNDVPSDHIGRQKC